MREFLLGCLILVSLALLSRVNELHDKVDGAGVALTHVTQELDKALADYASQRKVEEKKIDDAVKDVEVKVDAVPAPEPVTPEPPKKQAKRKVFFK